MAAIDNTTILIENGEWKDRLQIGDYEADAYKGRLILKKAGCRKAIWICTAEDIRRSLEDAVGIRDIILDSRDDIETPGRWEAEELSRLMGRFSITDRKTGKDVDISRFLMRHRKIFSDERKPQHLVIFRLGSDTVFWFPDNDAFGGASYSFILSDDGTLSIIVSGYGHYMNPSLHWLNRGLSETAEREIVSATWKQMTIPSQFHQLIAGRVFKGERWNRDGSLELGGFRRDTLTDQDVLRLYDRLKEIEEERYREWRNENEHH